MDLTSGEYLRGRCAWRDLDKPNSARLTVNRPIHWLKIMRGRKAMAQRRVAGTRAARHIRAVGKQQRRETACSVGVEWLLRMLG